MAHNVRLDLAEALFKSTPCSNFLPYPQITLYTDQKASLGLCGICQATQLELRHEDDSLSGAALTILPCGHVACQKCMDKCLKRKPECPFCRLPLGYELCSHSLKGRVITRENLLSLPETIPMGGIIPDQCAKCCVASNKVASETILTSLSESFQLMYSQYQKADERQKAAIKYRLVTLQQQFKIVANKLSTEATAAFTSQW